DDATLHAATRLRRADGLVTLHLVDVLDHHLAAVRVHVYDTTLLAAVLAAQHLDGVALLYLQPGHLLEHLRSQRDDLHESLLPQFARDRSEDAGPARVHLVVDQNRGVLVETDV